MKIHTKLFGVEDIKLKTVAQEIREIARDSEIASQTNLLSMSCYRSGSCGRNWERLCCRIFDRNNVFTN